MVDEICLHGYVSGQVQGVYFRQSTQKKARMLKLKGWVRNLPDGRVEFLICGAAVNVSLLRAWLEQGPPMARVTQVESVEQAWEAYADFCIT